MNPETDTTKFVNIDSEPFDIYINGKLTRHIEPGEEHVVTYYVAKVGAKHLADRVLQKQGIADSNRPSPLRDKIFSQIIPDITDEADVNPLPEEDYRKQIEKELKKQNEIIEALGGEVEKSKEKEDKIEKLEKEIEQLKKEKASEKVARQTKKQ